MQRFLDAGFMQVVNGTLKNGVTTFFLSMLEPILQRHPQEFAIRSVFKAVQLLVIIQVKEPLGNGCGPRFSAQSLNL